MRARRIPLLLLIVLVLPSSAFSEATGRAFVLDTLARAVVVVDLRDGSSVGRVEIPQLHGAEPEMLLTPDRSRLVLIDPGPHKVTWSLKLKPLGPSSVVVIDAQALKVIATTEVGWGVPPVRGAVIAEDRVRSHLALNADGTRLSLYCAGYESKKPEEQHAPEIVTVELNRGTIVGRLPVERPLASLDGLPDGRLVAFAPVHQAEKNDPGAPAELILIDPQKNAVAQKTTLTGDPETPQFSPDGQWLYLLDRGKPSKKAEKNLPGSVSVISAATGALEATVPAGTAPRGLVFDPDHEQLLFLSEGAPGGKEAAPGQMTVIRGAQVVASLPVVADPLFLRVRRDRIYVIGERAISLVPSSEWREQWQLPVQEQGATDLAFSPDGKRGFVLFAASSKLSVLDLDQQATVAHVGTGRGGVKFAKAVGAVAASMAATAASYAQGMSIARTQNSRWFTYHVYTFGPGAIRTSLVVRPDGKYVYALNTQTNDVTIVDGNNGSIFDKVACGGRVLSKLGERGPLVVIGKDTLRFLDTETQRVVRELKFEDAKEVELLPTPDSTRVVAFGGRSFFTLDSTSGAPVAQLPSFGRATAVAFDPGAVPVPAPVEAGREATGPR